MYTTKCRLQYIAFLNGPRIYETQRINRVFEHRYDIFPRRKKHQSLAIVPQLNEKVRSMLKYFRVHHEYLLLQKSN
jgi:hypothetical protein